MKLLIALLLLSPGLAYADPVSLIVGAITSLFTVKTLVYLGAKLLITAVMSSRAKKKARAAAARQSQPVNAQLSDRPANVISAIAPKKFVYGRPAPSGVNIFESFHSGDRDQYMHLLCAWANHPVESIDKVFIDGVDVGTLDANGWTTNGAFFEIRPDGIRVAQDVFDVSGRFPKPAEFTVIYTALGETSVIDPETGISSLQFVPITVTSDATSLIGPPGVYFRVHYGFRITKSNVNIKKHLGQGIDVAEPYLIAARPDLWTAAHRLSGTAYIVLTLDLDFAKFQNGPGEITILGRGKNDVYNFTNGTRGYTNNPARCIADYLMSTQGGGVALAQLDASFTAAQIACEEIIYPVGSNTLEDWTRWTGGDAQRFVCNGSFTADTNREVVIDGMESSCAGQLADSGGVWRLRVGTWTPPVLSITDADRLGPIEQVRGGTPGKELYNTSKVQYINWDALGGKPVQAPPFSNSGLVAIDGRERNCVVDTSFISSPTHLQQIQRIKVETSRGGQVIRYSGGLRLWPLQGGDRVYITDTDWAMTNKSYIVREKGFSLDGAVVLDLEEDIADYYDGSDYVQTLNPSNTDLPDAFAAPPTPAITSIQSGGDLLQIASSGLVLTTVRVTWTLPTYGYVVDGGSTELQWKNAIDATDVWTSVFVPGSANSADIAPAPDGQVIIIRVKHTSVRGVAGLWAIQSHAVIGKTAPPADVSGLTYMFEAYGIRANWLQVPDLDLSFYEIRIGGTSWATSTFVFKAKTTDHLLEAQLAGTRTLWVKAVDSSGNYSVNAASVNITVLAPYLVSFKDVRVEQNKVNFEWADARSSQPILRYNYRVAKVVGGIAGTYISRGGSGSDSRSDNIPFFEAATWRIEITATDVAGNTGPANTTDVLISLPDDYLPLLNTISTGGGVMVNAVKTGLFDRVTLLLNAAETWQAHFTSRGWNTIQDQINAGFPRYFQPGTTTASYTQDIDAGVVFTAGTIAVNLSINSLAGAPVSSIQIGYKRLIGDAYTFAAAGARNVIAQNFRYIRIIVLATGTGADLAEIELLQTSINVQKISENTTVACLSTDVNGTLYTTTRGFADVQGVIPGAIVQGSAITRVEARIVDAGAPGTPAQVFIYLFNAASQRISGNQYITINGL